MTHQHRYRPPGKASRLSNDTPGLPAFSAVDVFQRRDDHGPQHASLADTTARLAMALQDLSHGDLEGVTEDQLRAKGFTEQEIAACIDEAMAQARKGSVRRIRRRE